MARPASRSTGLPVQTEPALRRNAGRVGNGLGGCAAEPGQNVFTYDRTALLTVRPNAFWPFGRLFGAISATACA